MLKAKDIDLVKFEVFTAVKFRVLLGCDTV
jgi:hypothetical protein